MNSAFTFSSRQRIKSGFNNTVYGLSGTIFNFIFSVIIVRWLSPTVWGNFAQVMLLISLFGLITGWGNRDFLLREFSRAPRFPDLWQTSFISRLLILLPIGLLAVFLNPVPNNPLLFLVWVVATFVLRSFDSIIVYDKKFKEAIAIEITGFIFTLICFLIFRDIMTFWLLMILFIAATVIKSIVYFALFQNRLFDALDGKFSISYLGSSLPYFLPPFIGFLQAKSDTFAIALRLSEKELGEYYVLLSLLSYCHATSILAITPLLKNIYRINSSSFLKIRKGFFALGLLWSVVCMGVIYLMLTFIYNIELSSFTYLIAWLTLPPYFIYYLLMQDFLRKDKPYTIVVVNLCAACFNFLISMVMIKHFGFTGGLMSCAITQWLLLICFQVVHARKSPHLTTI